MATDVIFHTAYTVYVPKNRKWNISELINAQKENPNWLIEYMQKEIPHSSSGSAYEHKWKIYAIIPESIEPLWSNQVQFFAMKIWLVSDLWAIWWVLQTKGVLVPFEKDSKVLVEFYFAYYFEIKDDNEEIIIHLIHMRRSNINVHEIFLSILKDYYGSDYTVKILTDFHQQSADEIAKYLKRVEFIGRSTPEWCFNFGWVHEQWKGWIRLSITYDNPTTLWQKVKNFTENHRRIADIMDIDSTNILIEKDWQQKSIPIQDLDNLQQDLIVNLKKDRIMYWDYIPWDVFREQANSFKEAEESWWAIKTLLWQHYLPDS